MLHHGGETEVRAMKIAEALRDQGVRVVMTAGSQSIKSQMKKADASGARFAVFATADELAGGNVGVKALREGETQFTEQTLVAIDSIVETMTKSLAV